MSYTLVWWTAQQVTEFAKAVAPPIGTIGSAIILARGAFLTAHKITKQVEESKLTANAEQEELKRRMDLYKTLYTERLALAKLMAETACQMYQWCIALDVARPEQREKIVSQIVQQGVSLFSLSYSNEWLLTQAVSKASEDFRFTVIKAYSGKIPLTDRKLLDTLSSLNTAISDMMQRDDLSDLVKPQRTSSSLTNSG